MSNNTNWIHKAIRPHVYDGEIRREATGVQYRVIPKKGIPYTITSDKSLDRLRGMDKYKHCEIERV